ALGLRLSPGRAYLGRGCCSCAWPSCGGGGLLAPPNTPQISCRWCSLESSPSAASRVSRLNLSVIRSCSSLRWLSYLGVAHKPTGHGAGLTNKEPVADHSPGAGQPPTS